MKRVEWRRRADAAHLTTAGWELHIDGECRGTVWLDGGASSDMFGFKPFGSQPLAAQALLRAAGVEP